MRDMFYYSLELYHLPSLWSEDVWCSTITKSYTKWWNTALNCLLILQFTHITYCSFIMDTQSKPPQIWYKLWILPARCKLPTSCIKPVDFIKLHQVCEHETCCNLIFADLLQVDETTYIKPVCSLQLAASLLTTCNRLVIIKPEQAMRTHPDIGLVIADVLQLARFWLCRTLMTRQLHQRFF